MDNALYEAAKIGAELVGIAATVIKVLGDRQAKHNAKVWDRLNEIEKDIAADKGRQDEDVKRLRENVEQNRKDMKDGLDRITDRMYNRPR